MKVKIKEQSEESVQATFDWLLKRDLIKEELS
jgi:hypothetical protein